MKYYISHNLLRQKMLNCIKTDAIAIAKNTGVAKFSSRVLWALKKVERHLFVNEKYQNLAYENIVIPIEGNQTISQPFIVALMTELLSLKPSDYVLEIGTGSGYQTVILSLLAAKVYTIEILPNLYNSAKKKFKQLNINNVIPLLGDGSNGWPEYAPYHKIIITAAIMQTPSLLINQLALNGLIVAPIGKSLEQQALYVIEKSLNGIIIKETIPVVFVPMIK